MCYLQCECYSWSFWRPTWSTYTWPKPILMLMLWLSSVMSGVTHRIFKIGQLIVMAQQHAQGHRAIGPELDAQAAEFLACSSSQSIFQLSLHYDYSENILSASINRSFRQKAHIVGNSEYLMEFLASSANEWRGQSPRILGNSITSTRCMLQFQVSNIFEFWWGQNLRRSSSLVFNPGLTGTIPNSIGNLSSLATLYELHPLIYYWSRMMNLNRCHRI